jgi:hypothetical protein
VTERFGRHIGLRFLRSLKLTNCFPALLTLALLPCACSGDVAQEHVPADATPADSVSEPDISSDAAIDHVDAFESDAAEATSAESCSADPENPFEASFVVTCCGGRVCQGECLAGECKCGLIAGGCAPYLCCHNEPDNNVMCLPVHLCLPQK